MLFRKQLYLRQFANFPFSKIVRYNFVECCRVSVERKSCKCNMLYEWFGIKRNCTQHTHSRWDYSFFLAKRWIASSHVILVIFVPLNLKFIHFLSSVQLLGSNTVNGTCIRVIKWTINRNRNCAKMCNDHIEMRIKAWKILNRIWNSKCQAYALDMIENYYDFKVERSSFRMKCVIRPKSMVQIKENEASIEKSHRQYMKRKNKLIAILWLIHIRY